MIATFLIGLAAVWPLYVAGVLLLGVAYLIARAWIAYADWREQRSLLAIVERGRRPRP